MDKPYSQASENNKSVIYDVIKDYFNDANLVLEIGSGTGQHAVYFAKKMQQLYWQTSDQKQYLEGINCQVNEYQRYNLGRPVELDVTQNRWPVEKCQGVFSANTSHIMSWPMVEKMLTGVGNILQPKGYFCLYGPFNFEGKFTSQSNQDFDTMLRTRDPDSGLRDFEALEKFALDQELQFVKRHIMPANNCILVWRAKA